MSEDEHAQKTVKKAAIVVLISLSPEAEKKTSKELKTEIHKALEESLARIPWVAVEKIIVIEE
jgi:transposase